MELRVFGNFLFVCFLFFLFLLLLLFCFVSFHLGGGGVKIDVGVADHCVAI